MACCCISVDAGWQIKNIGSFKNEIGHQLRKLGQYLLKPPRDLSDRRQEKVRGRKGHRPPFINGLLKLHNRIFFSWTQIISWRLCTLDSFPLYPMSSAARAVGSLSRPIRRQEPPSSPFLLWHYEKRGGDEKGVLTDKVFWGPKRANAKKYCGCASAKKCRNAVVRQCKSVGKGGLRTKKRHALKRHKPSVYNYYVIVTTQG